MDKKIVGKLNKAFGVKGFIKVVPQKLYLDDLKRSDVWFIHKGNDVIPYFVEALEEEPHFLIKFEDVNSPEMAKTITGCSILLRNKDITVQAAKVEGGLENLVGFKVDDQGNVLGEISRIEEFPQQIMAFVLKEDIEFMMPLTPELIVNIDVHSKRLTVNLPEGFVESQF